ncbi:MAG: NAD-dependent epimerase/dehydratase family protein [Deltaproteobacteria bacterium]|nr:NAD-dependent epimerase/dehydratase family protein [Deltaproteobacteria bacterium]
MKVFLTGGTGFLGQPLTQKLIQRGWEVIALVRNPDSTQAKAIKAMGAQLVKGDITESGSMREAMGGTDVVIHSAAWYELGITKKAQAVMWTINVKGTENTLGLAVELGIPKIIYISTIMVFGDTGDVVADETFKRRRLGPAATWRTDCHRLSCRDHRPRRSFGLRAPGPHVRSRHASTDTLCGPRSARPCSR